MPTHPVSLSLFLFLPLSSLSQLLPPFISLFLLFLLHHLFHSDVDAFVHMYTHIHKHTEWNSSTHSEISSFKHLGKSSLQINLFHSFHYHSILPQHQCHHQNEFLIGGRCGRLGMKVKLSLYLGQVSKHLRNRNCLASLPQLSMRWESLFGETHCCPNIVRNEGKREGGRDKRQRQMRRWVLGNGKLMLRAWWTHIDPQLSSFFKSKNRRQGQGQGVQELLSFLQPPSFSLARAGAFFVVVVCTLWVLGAAERGTFCSYTHLCT